MLRLSILYQHTHIHHSIIILSRTLSRLDSTIYRANECVLKEAREKEEEEREEICNELSLFFSLKRDVLVLVQHVFSCRRQQIDMRRKMLVRMNKSSDFISTLFIE